MEQKLNKIICSNCYHKWKGNNKDSDFYFCHKCGYDNKAKKFNLIKLKDWIKNNQIVVQESLQNKLFKMNEELKKTIRNHFRKSILNENDSLRDLNKQNVLNIYKENSQEIFNLIMSFPEVWLEEIGIENILKFLEKEDSMNFRLQNGMTSGNPKIFKDTTTKNDDESEIDYLLRKNKINYTWDEIKNRLIQYFVQGIYRNVPADKILNTKEDLINFLKTYREGFLYGYIKPMIKI